MVTSNKIEGGVGGHALDVTTIQYNSKWWALRKQAAVATKEPTRSTSGEGKSARAQNRHAQSLCTLGEFQAPSYGMRERENVST